MTESSTGSRSILDVTLHSANQDQDRTWSLVDMVRDEALSKSRNRRGYEAIGHVYEAAACLRNSGGVISVESIASFCVENWGGPKAQSIRNNKSLKAVADAAIRATKSFRAKKTTKRLPYSDDLLSRVSDIQLRSEIEILLVEGRTLKAELNSLRSAFKQVQAIGEITEEMERAGLDTLEALTNSLRHRDSVGATTVLSAQERTACDRLLQDLAREGLGIDETSGEIITKGGRTFALNGVASVLSKAARGLLYERSAAPVPLDGQTR